MIDPKLILARIYLREACECTLTDDELRAWLSGDHSGDCTKDPWTCRACLAEEAVGVASAQLEALSGAGYVVVAESGAGGFLIRGGSGLVGK